MFKSVYGILGGMVLSAVTATSPSLVSAEEVSLTFDAQGFTITGELIGLTEVGYMVMTDAGEFTIPFGYVSCEGNACPTIEQTDSEES